VSFLTVYGGGSLQVYLYLFFFACFKKSSRYKGPSMSSRDSGAPELYLTLEELKEIAADVKENLQRAANQGIRKKDWEQGIGSLASIEAIETFLYNCSLRAGEFAPARAEQRQRLFNPPQKKRKRGAVTELPAPVPVVRKRAVSE
jgi:hypothetical protein